MKLTLIWQPVLEKLPLSKYNPAAAGDDHFMVCVNPEKSFMDERTAILREFSERFAAYEQASKSIFLNDQQSPELTEEQQAEFLLKRRAETQGIVKDFLAWSENDFSHQVNHWYARLLSFGDDKYTAEELAEFGRVDVHFINWLYSECMQMIDAHRSARKKK